MADRSNDQWIADLQKSAAERENAVDDLRRYLRDKLVAAFSSRTASFTPARRRYSVFRTIDADEFAEDVAQEAVVRILDRLSTFRGESRFTSWALRIAINLGYTELRRKEWRALSLDALAMPEFPVGSTILNDRGDSPETLSIKRGLMKAVNEAIAGCLTDHQRRALVAIAIHGVPIEEVARRLDTNRNALYKTMHDARKRIKAAIEQSGFQTEDVNAILS